MSSKGKLDDTPLVVTLDFPQVAAGVRLTAKTIFVVDVADKDIAVLELTEDAPNGCGPAPLAAVGDLWGNEFRTFGFPNDREQGVWSAGILRGRQAAGWLQVEDTAGSYKIERGFSGAPVFDEQLQAVIGMIVATESSPSTRAAYAIPIDVLAKSWPALSDHIRSSHEGYRSYLSKLSTSLGAWQQRYTPMFAKFERFTLFAKAARSASESDPEPLLAVIARYPKLVLLGVAGAGKTTTIQRVALDHAQRTLRGERNPLVPVIVALRDYHPMTIRQGIQSELHAYQITGAVIENDLGLGKYLLIFDGLNEVPEMYKEECCKELRQLMREYPSNRYLFTARPTGYESDCLAITEVEANVSVRSSLPAWEIQPLTRGQIDDCIRRYFLSDPNDADSLVTELQLHIDDVWTDPASLVQLAQVPLLLQMLILTYETKHRIPHNEGELLLAFVDDILTRREPGKWAGEYFASVKKRLLAGVAWEMHQNGFTSSLPTRMALGAFTSRLGTLQSAGLAPATYVAEEIWQEVQNNNLLVVDAERTSWPHPLYQDLFIGLELHMVCFDDRWQPRQDAIEAQLEPRRAKWFDSPSFDAGIVMLCTVPEDARVIALVAVSRCNPSLVWQAYLRLEPEYHPSFQGNLLAALELAGSSIDLKAAEHRNIVQLVKEFDASDSCPILQRLTESSPTESGRREAMVFMWSRCRNQSRDAIVSVLRHALDKDSSGTIRVTAFCNLGQLIDETLATYLLERLMSEPRGTAGEMLACARGWIASAAVRQALVDIAESHDQVISQRQQALWALGETAAPDRNVREVLRRMVIAEAPASLRREAVAALRHFPSRGTVNTLANALEDSNELVRLEAITSLIACVRHNIVPALSGALQDSSSAVADSAMDALASIVKTPRAFDTVRNYAHDASVIVRRRAIKVLARLASSADDKIRMRASRELALHTNERDKRTLLDVAWGLQIFDPNRSTSLFRLLLADESAEIREAARQRIEALGITLE